MKCSNLLLHKIYISPGSQQYLEHLGENLPDWARCWLSEFGFFHPESSKEVKRYFYWIIDLFFKHDGGRGKGGRGPRPVFLPVNNIWYSNTGSEIRITQGNCITAGNEFNSAYCWLWSWMIMLIKIILIDGGGRQLHFLIFQTIGPF